MAKNVERFLIGLALLALVSLSACSAPAAEAAGSAAGPETVVESFYGWAIDYQGFDPETGQFNNYLVDGSYAERPELAPEMIEHIQSVLASFEGSPGGGYDPILCAQDVPQSITVGEAQVQGNEARVLVETSFEGHSFTVKLQQTDGTWQIIDVLCAVGS